MQLGKKVMLISLKEHWSENVTYNSDCYYNPNDPNNPDFHADVIPGAKQLEDIRGYKKAYPTSDERALGKSQHLKNIEEQQRLLH